jgi:hypothetical protein
LLFVISPALGNLGGRTVTPVRRFIITLVVVVFTGLPTVGAEVQSFPPEWFIRPPTPERIVDVQTAAAASGWISVSAGLYAGAIGAYEHGQTDAAEAWYYAAKWTNLFGQTQADVGNQWWDSINKADLANASLRKPSLPSEPMSRLITPEMSAWMLGDRAFSSAFWGMVSPYDNLPQVLVILRKIREDNPARFKTYTQLALAIALVYDSAPPPSWPHAQVSDKALPRKLMRPWEVFKFLADSDERGVTLHKLGQLTAGDLRFLVDLAAPFSDLLWAQQSMKFTLAQLSKTYDCVRYRQDRIANDQYVWPSESYELSRIYSEGGICVDQAYFATQAGKARGVPTLLFVGEGKDGRHAWFGYLDRGDKWMLDAGRYEEQRFVTGVAYDPQIWGLISDHELKFLTDGFRKLPPYKQSYLHTIFADLYLRLGEKARPAAAAAARKAVNYERRNAEAWDLLLAANADAPPKAREALLREAALALVRYPDLNARYVRELAASLRARGEVSAANFEERSVALKNKGNRADIGIEQAAKLVDEVLLSGASVQQEMAVYRDVLQKYGAGGGTDFYDRVVVPFVTKVASQGHRGEARAALGQARFALKPESGSQLEKDIVKFDAQLK